MPSDSGPVESSREECPFCQIVTGHRRQEIVYEDDTVVAFLCEPPATWGHKLVVPREHRCDINQLSVETPDLDGWSYSEAAGYGQEV